MIMCKCIFALSAKPLSMLNGFFRLAQLRDKFTSRNFQQMKYSYSFSKCLPHNRYHSSSINFYGSSSVLASVTLPLSLRGTHELCIIYTDMQVCVCVCVCV